MPVILYRYDLIEEESGRKDNKYGEFRGYRAGGLAKSGIYAKNAINPGVYGTVHRRFNKIRYLRERYSK